MATRGRPRIPTELKLLRGNPGHRWEDVETNEPRPNIEIPACPDFLKGEAREEWDRITKELALLKLISQLDRAAIAAYCVQWGRWVEAEAKLANEPHVFKTVTGYPVRSPWLDISNKALELMHKYLVEFGLTAASRTRIRVKPTVADDAPMGARRFLA